jgi:PHD/YefM family antitoxin component YafN of YafNO toxin-antitoxin module
MTILNATTALTKRCNLIDETTATHKPVTIRGKGVMPFYSLKKIGTP